MALTELAKRLVTERRWMELRDLATKWSPDKPPSDMTAVVARAFVGGLTFAGMCQDDMRAALEWAGVGIQLAKGDEDRYAAQAAYCMALYNHQGDYEQVLKSVPSGVPLDTEHAWSFLILYAMACVQLHRPQDALTSSIRSRCATLGRAERIQTTECVVGESLMCGGNLDDARKHLEDTVCSGEYDGLRQMLLGEVYLLLKNNGMAAIHARRAKRILSHPNPKSVMFVPEPLARAHLTLMRVAHANKDPESVLYFYQHMVRDPLCPPHHFAEAVALLRECERKGGVTHEACLVGTVGVPMYH